MRSDIADGLKALALLGVFMVNGLGYALAPNYPMQLGAPMPIDSALAQTIHAFALTFFMGKALPFLAFSYGYSMAHVAKRTTGLSSSTRRQYKLLLVGVLHGALVYFGDILTAYALVALWLGGCYAMRGRKLLARLRWWLALSAALLLYRLFLEWQSFQPLMAQDASDGWLGVMRLSQTNAYGTFLTLNATAYFGYLVGWLMSYYAPLHMALFLAEILAARYRCLSLKPRLPLACSRSLVHPWLARSWPLALAANAALALAALQLHRQHGLAANIYWITVLNVPLGLWLVTSSLVCFMRHIQAQQKVPPWLVWLAPAGRHTLVMYLGLSLVLMLCGRLGLFASESTWNHTAVWFAALLGLWLGAVWLGRMAAKKGMRDPISRWLSR